MKVKNTALRLAGAAMIALAMAPWVGGSAASAGRDASMPRREVGTAQLSDDRQPSASPPADDCPEITIAEHVGQAATSCLHRWHGLTTFTASFADTSQSRCTVHRRRDALRGVTVRAGKDAVGLQRRPTTILVEHRGLATPVGHAATPAATTCSSRTSASAIDAARDDATAGHDDRSDDTGRRPRRHRRRRRTPATTSNPATTSDTATTVDTRCTTAASRRRPLAAVAAVGRHQRQGHQGR